MPTTSADLESMRHNARASTRAHFSGEYSSLPSRIMLQKKAGLTQDIAIGIGNPAIDDACGRKMHRPPANGKAAASKRIAKSHSSTF